MKVINQRMITEDDGLINDCVAELKKTTCSFKYYLAGLTCFSDTSEKKNIVSPA